ncbi:MAG: hypothetical protein ACRDHC_03445, partial [Actinomycetota bacterium]
AYDAPNPVELRELGSFDPLGGIFGGDGMFDETMRVFGIRTNEGRWSAIQATEVEMGRIRLRYRTWEKRIPSVEIRGGWTCEGGFDLPIDPGSVIFEPAEVLSVDVATDPRPDPCAGIVATVRDALPADVVEQRRAAELWRAGGKLGTWRGTILTKARPVARFDAVTQGFGDGQVVRWGIGGSPLSDPSGDVEAGGEVLHYEVSGRRLELRTKANEAFEFFLDVRVEDERGVDAESSRCVRFEPGCALDVRYVPPWREYLDVYLARFGVVEVPERMIDEGPSGPDVTIRSGSRTST